MIDFLLEKAKRQIEHSNDDGDCAGQARYWAQKLVKAAVKKNCDHIALIDWAIGIAPKDIYFLTDAKTIVLDKNKVASVAIWNKIANHYKNSNQQIYHLALQKAGRSNERKESLKKIAGRKKDYAFLVEDALSRGNRVEALKICERGIVQSEGDQIKVRHLEKLAAIIEATQGNYEREFKLRKRRLLEDPSLENYKSLLELAVVLNRSKQIRDEVLEKLEAKQKWHLLLKIALHEYRLLDAVEYYWQIHKGPHGVCCGYNPFNLDFDLAARLTDIYPIEAKKILCRVVSESLAAYQPMYEYIERALISLKSIFLVLRKSEEMAEYLQSLRNEHPRKRNLMEIIEKLASTNL